jgi:hypothetical protein
VDCAWEQEKLEANTVMMHSLLKESFFGGVFFFSPISLIIYVLCSNETKKALQLCKALGAKLAPPGGTYTHTSDSVTAGLVRIIIY